MASSIASVFLAALLLAVSLLTVVRAPSLALWKLAIVVGELGHLLAALPLVLAVWASVGTDAPRAALAGIWALSATAIVLLLKPSFQAARLAWSIPASLREAFGESVSLNRKAWSWRRAYRPRSHRRRVQPETCVYAAGATSLRLDFFRVREKDPAPCVVVIHGGGWDDGERRQFESFSAYLAERGYAVASVDYRLAPGHVWPAQRDDILGALRHLVDGAAGYGIDPERLVLFGRSAGGQIAEAVAYGPRPAGVRGVIAFYAPADLNFAWKHTPGADLLDCFRLMRQYTGGTPDSVPTVFDDASPYLRVSADAVPTLLAHGRLDPLVWHRQSERLAARLTEAGGAVHFLDLPWATHAFDYFAQGPGGQLSTYAIEWFLGAVCDVRRESGSTALPRTNAR